MDTKTIHEDPIFPGERFDENAQAADAYTSALDRPGDLEPAILAPILLDGRTERDRLMGIDLCPVCGTPAHATESDDEGRHMRCRPQDERDTDALDQLEAELNGYEWDADVLDQIARIVESTGRAIHGPDCQVFDRPFVCDCGATERVKSAGA